MNRLIIMVIACLLAGCSLFKQQVRDKKEHSFTATVLARHEQKNNTEERKVLIIRDSIQENFMVEIIPEGVFSYSAKDGFKGAGLAIKMKGNRSAALGVLKGEELEASSHNLEQTERTARKKETDSKSRQVSFKINFGYFAFGLISLCVLWLWFKRK